MSFAITDVIMLADFIKPPIGDNNNVKIVSLVWACVHLCKHFQCKPKNYTTTKASRK
jgi:hypothetical protein